MNKLVSLHDLGASLHISNDQLQKIIKDAKIEIFNIGEEEYVLEADSADIYIQSGLELTEEDGETVEVDRGKYDQRNKLNDLTGKEWMPETKSFWYQKGLGKSHPHAQIEKQHPAPFSFQDISRLVNFFTKEGDTVLDPFSGVGSTVKAANLLTPAKELALSCHQSGQNYQLNVSRRKLAREYQKNMKF